MKPSGKPSRRLEFSTFNPPEWSDSCFKLPPSADEGTQVVINILYQFNFQLRPRYHLTSCPPTPANQELALY